MLALKWGEKIFEKVYEMVEKTLYPHFQNGFVEHLYDSYEICSQEDIE